MLYTHVFVFWVSALENGYTESFYYNKKHKSAIMISDGYFVMNRLILTSPPSQKPVPELLSGLCRSRARKWTRGAPQIDSAGSQRWYAWRKTIFVPVINFHRPSAGFFTLVRPLPAADGAHSALGITKKSLCRPGGRR